tara:strand:+ start:182 stop:430 length:249 start_codon:yes stop_codon:yes gene_type:complete
MKDVKMIQVAKRKKESREIAKQVIDFGVKEDQKIDIMFNIAMTLENNLAMKEITDVLKKFRENINKKEDNDNIEERSNKILI